MKKVLYIIPSLELGGAEVLLINHLECLDLERFDPTLLIVGKKTALTSRIRRGVKIIKIGATKSNCIFKLPKVAMIVSEIKPDVIHSHMYSANILGRILGLLTKSRVLNHYHGLSLWLSSGKLFIDRITQNLMDAGVVVSEASYNLRLKREKINQKKLKLIYNFVCDFPHDLEPKPVLHDTLVLGMACRLISLKNIPSVIHLVKFLRANDVPAKLLVAGSGPEQQKLTDLISELGLEDHVELLGFQSDLSEFYQRVNVYVIASETEDLPLSLAEAMSFGCAVISSDVGGIKSILDKAEGFVVERIDKDSFDPIMNYVNNLDVRRIFKKNRRVAENLFHYRKYSSEIEALY